jgi:hypothetical protein
MFVIAAHTLGGIGHRKPNQSAPQKALNEFKRSEIYRLIHAMYVGVRPYFLGLQVMNSAHIFRRVSKTGVVEGSKHGGHSNVTQDESNSAPARGSSSIAPRVLGNIPREVLMVPNRGESDHVLQCGHSSGILERSDNGGASEGHFNVPEGLDNCHNDAKMNHYGSNMIQDYARPQDLANVNSGLVWDDSDVHCSPVLGRVDFNDPSDRYDCQEFILAPPGGDAGVAPVDDHSDMLLEISDGLPNCWDPSGWQDFIVPFGHADDDGSNFIQGSPDDAYYGNLSNDLTGLGGGGSDGNGIVAPRQLEGGEDLMLQDSGNVVDPDRCEVDSHIPPARADSDVIQGNSGLELADRDPGAAQESSDIRIDESVHGPKALAGSDIVHIRDDADAVHICPCEPVIPLPHDAAGTADVVRNPDDVMAMLQRAIQLNERYFATKNEVGEGLTGYAS